MKEVERNNVVTVRQRESEMFINESYLLQKLLFHFVLLIKSEPKERRHRDTLIKMIFGGGS